MVSKLEVDTIAHSGGTTGMTIDSSGRVLTPARPSFYAYNSSNFGTGTGSGTKVVLNSTRHNTGNHYSTSTGKFTCPVAGLYFFHVSIQTVSQASAITYFSAEITATISSTERRFIGGWTEKYGTTNTHHGNNTSVILEMGANDTVQMSHESQADVQIMGDDRHTYLMGYLIG